MRILNTKELEHVIGGGNWRKTVWKALRTIVWNSTSNYDMWH